MAQRKILLAEDNPLNQKVLKAMLEEIGFVATAVSNGRDALNELRKESYDLLLLDCQMPELDGFQVSREIRCDADERVRGTPIVALTGSSVPGDRERCLAAGMNDFLAKPFRIVELKAIIAKWS